MYTPVYFDKLCPVLKHCLPAFDCNDFIFGIFNNDWPDENLKEKVRHISRVLQHFLSKDFAEAAGQIVEIVHELKRYFPAQCFENIFFADYIEIFGLDCPDIALRTLQDIGQFVNTEFALRAFLIHHPDKAVEHLVKWSSSDNAYMRRLASESLKTLHSHSKVDPIMN